MDSKQTDALTNYPEFFRMDFKELEDRIDVMKWKMPTDDHARNWEGWDELSALEIALQMLQEKTQCES
jgi:hypothetical protein